MKKDWLKSAQWGLLNEHISLALLAPHTYQTCVGSRIWEVLARRGNEEEDVQCNES